MIKGDKKFLKKVERITFDDFKKMANDDHLTSHEKIGFPDNYRDNYTENIFNDIVKKMPNLMKKNQKIADIGCGCDQLAKRLISHCESFNDKLYLFDSAEMLKLLPQGNNVVKISGKFPDNDEEILAEKKEFFDSIIVYSVMQHIILDSNPFTFIDKALSLLAPGGKLLLGDLPNRSKRKRFFVSPQGIKTHQEYTKSDEIPNVNLLELEVEKLDDSILFAILQRYRNAGMESYLLPQMDDLPMSTRREDILIVKPQ